MWWRDHAKVLEGHGYILRSRYQPGWQPSWVGTDIQPAFCEDSFRQLHRESQPKVIDAKRACDGMSVMIKKCIVTSTEITIARSLTTPELLRDPMNHCIPILDTFQVESELDLQFIVMPVLRFFFDPPFFAVGEALDFIKQTLEGIVFLHGQGVAHRDCSRANILMDATAMYPRGFHPIGREAESDGVRVANPLRRMDASYVKYYFVDFGISTHFPDPKNPFRVVGGDGQDQEVPDLSAAQPYDAYPVDVFILGNLYKKTFVLAYNNLRPLVEAMTQKEPCARPNAVDALAQFNAIYQELKPYTRRWRLEEAGESAISRHIGNIGSAAREIIHQSKHFFGS
ncbi:hypothetical protein BD410DRAFT_816219 [Rickenella mellea]|uniref:Protein kinase domain-containing protein n=1 Tax=Rickenella mellea TaxID=50990 RepID=A0A4Y7PTJ0_9AGAM|nr:hypothetical protein BD410DRAFT_816219 [Rickenella mellea]